MAVGADRQVHVREHVVQGQAIGFLKRAGQQRLRDLKADAIAIVLREVVAARDLQDVVCELDHEVPRRRIHVERG